MAVDKHPLFLSKTLIDLHQIKKSTLFSLIYDLSLVYFLVGDHIELTLNGIVNSLSIPGGEGGYVDVRVTHIDYGLCFVDRFQCFISVFGIVYAVLSDKFDAIKKMEQQLQQQVRHDGSTMLFNPVYGKVRFFRHSQLTFTIIFLGHLGIAHIDDSYRRAFVLDRTDIARVQVGFECIFKLSF